MRSISSVFGLSGEKNWDDEDEVDSRNFMI